MVVQWNIIMARYGSQLSLLTLSLLNKNKPKGLKVAKEELRLIGLMVNRLDG